MRHFLAFCVIVYEQSCQKNNPGVVYLQCSYTNKLIEVMNEIDRGNDGGDGCSAGRGAAAGAAGNAGSRDASGDV